MALEQNTSVDQIEILPTGHVHVRIGLAIYNGAAMLSRSNHRASFAPGSDIAAGMAEVNQHLVCDGRQPVNDGDIARVEAHARVAFTEAAVAAYEAASAAIAAAHEEAAVDG